MTRPRWSNVTLTSVSFGDAISCPTALNVTVAVFINILSSDICLPGRIELFSDTTRAGVVSIEELAGWIIGLGRAGIGRIGVRSMITGRGSIRIGSGWLGIGTGRRAIAIVRESARSAGSGWIPG